MTAATRLFLQPPLCRQRPRRHFQNWSPRAWTTSRVSGSALGSDSAVLTGRCAQREPTTEVKPNTTETWKSTRFKSLRGARGPGLSPRSSLQGSPLFLSSAVPDPLTPAQAQLTPFLAPQSSPPGAARKLSGNSVCPAVAVTAGVWAAWWKCLPSFPSSWSYDTTNRPKLNLNFL